MEPFTIEMQCRALRLADGKDAVVEFNWPKEHTAALIVQSPLLEVQDFRIGHTYILAITPKSK